MQHLTYVVFINRVQCHGGGGGGGVKETMPAMHTARWPVY